MFRVLRQDKTLSGADLEFLVAELVEAMTVYAVEKKIFRQSFFSVGIMTAGTRVVAQPADIELFEQGIVLDAGLQYRFRNLYPLSADAVPDILV